MSKLRRILGTIGDVRALRTDRRPPAVADLPVRIEVFNPLERDSRRLVLGAIGMAGTAAPFEPRNAATRAARPSSRDTEGI